MKIFIMLLFVSVSAYAQVFSMPLNPEPVPVSEPKPTPEPAKFSCPACPEEEESSATNRDDSFGTFMAGYQFLNTWVPSKITASYTQILSRNYSLELEYGTSKKDIKVAGVDAGELKEERYTLLLKHYIGKSFHIGLGPYVADLSLELDDSVTDRNGNRINKKSELSLIGITFNIGNRWQYDNGVTFGVDWLRMNQPTGTYKTGESILNDVEEDNQDNVKRTNKFFRTTPTFTLFGISVGYTF